MCALFENKRVILKGVGGNHHLVNFLAFYIARTSPDILLTIVDGGFYKLHHRNHELFTGLQNKAIETKERLFRDFPNLKIEAVPLYVDYERSDISILPEDVFQEGDIIFNCVDNNASIKLDSIFCEKLKDVALIVSGIGEADVLVQNYVKVDGIELTPPIHTWNPFVANPTDRIPSEVLRDGCPDEVRGEQPNLFALNMAGCLSLCVFFKILDHLRTGTIKEFDLKNVNFNVLRVKMRVEHLKS